MTVPTGYEDVRYAELTLALPQSWEVSMEAFADERRSWPSGS